ncbi:MAG: dehydrogenase [Christensenellaceae bacterium]|jgi:D-glycero-alpha-D-manno-heptose-7-phosphate kinase|nr:dehydrogenase [Christensenellaceae bacterium]
MEIRSRAPLRIGFAGGGTDLESYSNRFGGCVLNSAICMYAYCTIYPSQDNRIKIQSYDNKNSIDTESVTELPIIGDHLILHRGVYNHIVKNFNDGKPLSFFMCTSNDAPVGSGLGTSSTMVIAIIEAFDKWLRLGLSDYQKASMAYDIERKELKLAGGKQDQYAAVFGGFNFMEFRKDGNVIVNSLHLSRQRILELESSMLLFYSGISRKSAEVQLELAKNIVKDQIKNTETEKQTTAMDAMQKIKENAAFMKDCVLIGDFEGIKQSFREAWENKKKTSSFVSNKKLEDIISHAMKSGAEAIKVSGAGGGGFLLMLCNPINRQKLQNSMEEIGKVYPVKLTPNGAESWVIPQAGDKVK